ncbi:MAG TPA: glycerol-3-phosphate acyltransferase, partial [Dehalococcoidia bacterium]|nr:glycerol-3-phosphate acyltransferase [Dehalococcoidia bacterium]
MQWHYLFIACLGYLIGSVPVGVLVGRWARGVDVRDFGSGKTGFTNSLRTLGPGLSAVVLGGDFIKGAGPVLLASALYRGGAREAAPPEVVAATAAVLGHVWPLYARFKGGRGVATALGATTVMMPQIGVVLLLVALGVVYVYRYMSLGSIVATQTGAILVWALVIGGRLPLAYGLWGTI